jgi:hypothetical protein
MGFHTGPGVWILGGIDLGIVGVYMGLILKYLGDCNVLFREDRECQRISTFVHRELYMR